MEERFWGCKIGPVTEEELETLRSQGADLSMRRAVGQEFSSLLRRGAAVLSSGWGFKTTYLSDEPEPEKRPENAPVPGGLDSRPLRSPVIVNRIIATAGDGKTRDLRVQGWEHLPGGVCNVYVRDEPPGLAPRPGAGEVAAEVAKLKRAVELERQKIDTDLRDLRIAKATSEARLSTREHELYQRRHILDRFLNQVKEGTG